MTTQKYYPLIALEYVYVRKSRIKFEIQLIFYELMDVLPVEILLEIGKTNLATYRGMLAIPMFARAVTIGFRLNMMAAVNYDYNKMLLHKCCYNHKIVVRKSKSGKVVLFVGESINIWSVHIQGKIRIYEHGHEYISHKGMISSAYAAYDNGNRVFDDKCRVYRDGRMVNHT